MRRRLELSSIAAAACSLLSVFVLACNESPTALVQVAAGPSTVAVASPPSLTWLSPLGTGVADAGTFDAAASPVVEVCVWSGSGCTGPLITRFSTAPTGSDVPLTINTAVGRYEGTWSLADAQFTTRRTYRVRVLQGAQELGSTFVDVVRGRWALTRFDGTLAPLTSASSITLAFHLGIALQTAVVAVSRDISAAAHGHLAQLVTVFDEQLGDGPAAVALLEGAKETPAFAVDVEGKPIYMALAPGGRSTALGPVSTARAYIRLASGIAGIRDPQRVDSVGAAHPLFNALVAMIRDAADQGMSFVEVPAISSTVTTIVGAIANTPLGVAGLSHGATNATPSATGTSRALATEAPEVPFPVAPISIGDGPDSQFAMRNQSFIEWRASVAVSGQQVSPTVTLDRRSPSTSLVDIIVDPTHGGFFDAITNIAGVEGRSTVSVFQDDESRQKNLRALVQSAVSAAVATAINSLGGYPAVQTAGPLVSEIVDDYFAALGGESPGTRTGKALLRGVQEFLVSHKDKIGRLVLEKYVPQAVKTHAAVLTIVVVLAPEAAPLLRWAEAAAESLDELVIVAQWGIAATVASQMTAFDNIRDEVAICQHGGVPEARPDCDLRGPLTNGLTYTGRIAAGGSERWTFTAQQNDFVVASAGEAGTFSAKFEPWVRVYGPNGALLVSDHGPAMAQASLRVPASGTYTVVVASGDGPVNSTSTETGEYRLTMIRSSGTLETSPNDQGGPIVNGGTAAGDIYTGDVDAWTFTARAGEYLVLGLGETDPHSATFAPQLRLVSPTGALLEGDRGAITARVGVLAPATGTYTVLVETGDDGVNIPRLGTGAYRLSLARGGAPVTTADDDQGGPMDNGITHVGRIYAGDLDSWTFVADAGEYFLVSMGKRSGSDIFQPDILVLGPDGAVVTSDNAGVPSGVTAQVQGRAPRAGTYTVVVSSGDYVVNGLHYAGTGDYRLTLIRTGSPVISSPDDQGELMVNGATYDGAVYTGDLDGWSFTAEQGDYLLVSVGKQDGTDDFQPALWVLGPDGAVLGYDNAGFPRGTVALVEGRAPRAGRYTVVVGSGDAVTGGHHALGTGTYRLSSVRVPGNTVVSLGDEGGTLTDGVGGNIYAGDIDAWTVEAQAGDTVTIQMTRGGGTLFAAFRLVDGTGRVVAEGRDPYGRINEPARAQFVARSATTYTVIAYSGDAIIGGPHNTGAGPYTFNVTRARASTPPRSQLEMHR